jgi:hypothetical protein
MKNKVKLYNNTNGDNWLPGPGFLGTYRFKFLETERGGYITRKDVLVNTSPKF